MSTTCLDRYSTLKLIPWWNHNKISNARVMVVGAGALGNEILKNLALLGIGNILIVDFDVIEMANLTRSVLFRKEDIGKSKAQVAAERLKELNPDIRVAYICGDINSDVGLGVFRDIDIVIVGVDNFGARIAVNRACWKMSIPWVNGGIQEMSGEFHIYIPGKGACYECNMPIEGYHQINRRLSCLLPIEQVTQGKVPTTPTIASIVAALQVQEALKLIHKQKIEGGSGIVYNGITNEFMPTYFPLNIKCLNHKSFQNVISLDLSAAKVTCGEVLMLIKDKLGPEAIIELDFDLIDNLSCMCGFSSEGIKRLDKFDYESFKCPQCGKLMKPHIVSSIDKDSSRLLDKTLIEVQIPLYHIITVRNSSSVFQVVLNADKNETLIFI